MSSGFNEDCVQRRSEVRHGESRVCDVAQLSSAGVWAKCESDTDMKTLCIIYKHPVVADGGICDPGTNGHIPSHTNALVGH